MDKEIENIYYDVYKNSWFDVKYQFVRNWNR